MDIAKCCPCSRDCPRRSADCRKDCTDHAAWRLMMDMRNAEIFRMRETEQDLCGRMMEHREFRRKRRLDG